MAAKCERCLISLSLLVFACPCLGSYWALLGLTWPTGHLFGLTRPFKLKKIFQLFNNELAQLPPAGPGLKPNDIEISA